MRVQRTRPRSTTRPTLRGLCALVALIAALRAQPAAAEAVDLTPESHQLAITGELGYFAQSQDASSLYLFVPRVGVQYALNQRFSLAADWGVIGIDSVPEQGSAESVFRAGNPTLFGLYRDEFRGLRYRFGLGGAVPVAGIDMHGQGRLQHVAFNDAQGLSGLWDPWLWAPDRAAAIGFGQAELDIDPELRLQFELAPALLIPVYGAFGRDGVDVFVPTALSLSTHKGPVWLGLRFQAVFMPTNNVDMLQIALEPWLRVLIGSAFVELRYTGNVDEPLAGSRGPDIWGFHVAGGGVL